MKKRTESNHRYWPFVLAGLFLVIAFYISWVYFVAKPTISPSFSIKDTSVVVPAKTLDWPSGTQAAVGLVAQT
jgi:hypothetical protein